MENFIAFAHALADASGTIINPYFESVPEAEIKPDNSPVTIADREAETAMRALIEQTYPDHAIYGEETGHTKTISEYTWVLDPIDGTKAFIAGRKEWGTLIALCRDGVPILGVLNQPATGERWLGVKGQATILNKAEIKTRSAQLADAELSTTSINYFTPDQAKKVVKLAKSVQSTVQDGDCYAYGQLARGARDLVIDAGLKAYDILALVPIIENAGGTITAWDGSAITMTNFQTALAAGNAKLHAEAKALLA